MAGPIEGIRMRRGVEGWWEAFSACEGSGAKSASLAWSPVNGSCCSADSREGMAKE